MKHADAERNRCLSSVSPLSSRSAPTTYFKPASWGWKGRVRVGLEYTTREEPRLAPSDCLMSTHTLPSSHNTEYPQHDNPLLTPSRLQTPEPKKPHVQYSVLFLIFFFFFQKPPEVGFHACCGGCHRQ